MILPNKLFDILKWIDLIVLPAIGTAYVGLAKIWGFPYPDEISGTIMILCTLIGALLGISNVNYYMNQSLEMPEDEVEVDNNNVGEG